MKNSTLLRNPVSKCKTTLVNLIEYLFVSLLEELFFFLVCRVFFLPPSFQVLLEETVGSGLKENKHLFHELSRIFGFSGV